MLAITFFITEILTPFNNERKKRKWSCSVVFGSLRPHGLEPTRLLCPWNFPSKSTGVGCQKCTVKCLLFERTEQSKWRSDFNIRKSNRRWNCSQGLPSGYYEACSWGRCHSHFREYIAVLNSVVWLAMRAIEPEFELLCRWWKIGWREKECCFWRC